MMKTLLFSQLSDGKPKKISQLLSILHCSESKLWQEVKALQTTGIAQFQQTNDSIQLVFPLSVLKQNYLQKLCPKRQIQILTITDSTNDFLLSKKERQNGEIVTAEWQSAGRGQAGREWFSPFGGQIIMSMFWQYPDRNVNLQGLSVRLGIAAAEALRGAGFHEVMLKWPNDLYLYGRKLGGILPEIVSRGKTIDIVAGIGINLIPSPKIVKSTACLQECGEVKRPELIALITQAWEKAFFAVEEGQAINPQKWLQFDIYQGKRIILSNQDKILVGNNAGIDPLGRILLENEGEIYAFYIGEVRLLPHNQ